MASMIRNMDHHRAWEDDEGIQWSMWQAEQLKTLEKYKKANQKRYGKQFKDINGQIGEILYKARQTGNMQQEIQILNAIKNGFTGVNKVTQGTAAEFFRLNDRKLEALIKATTNDMERVETAVLRKANDEYRKAIYNAQVYANTGAGTYEKAVDMATKDMLSRGLACVEYANGARHTLADYADMAIRTASKRAYLTGEGEKRQEWGIATVIVNKRGNPCPKCLPFCGKVLIDDVWSGGKKSDGPYPLMSKAIAAGLYHPRCKDSHTTYFPGISTADDTWTKEELESIGQANKQELERQYAERQAERFERLAKYSLSPENKKQYKQKADEWEKKAGERYAVSDEIKVHREDTPIKMVDLVERYAGDEFVMLNETAEHAFAYDSDLDAVVINPEHSQYPYYDYKEIMIHEIAHRIDQNEFGSPMNKDFVEAILKTERKVMSNAEKYQKLFAPGGELEYNDLISDIFGCITDNMVVGAAYHESQYIGIPGYTELEVFANLFSATYQGSDATVQFIKSELGELYEAFLGVMEG
ncbi:phage minor capsid protein [Hungatella hathewayi]|uniref:phage minor capsid protein n=1 Tax=Hungatella hathewayi TaxID=154046 RepID=UPI003D80EC5E